MNEITDLGGFNILDSGSYVKIRYKVKIVGGPILKGAEEPEIMDFVTGYKQVIAGLENGLLGHVQGDKISFEVPPDEAFGLRNEDLVFVKKKEEFHFPPGFVPYPGMEISVICDADSGPDTVTIKDVRDDGIVIDFNHALAGYALAYEIEILEARPARGTDVCAEWDKDPASQTSCDSAPHEIILGKED
ncbi:MAG: FKBP-type peptidyl-prolyl cis-trans isomerase [Pseudomonadota bacterium]